MSTTRRLAFATPMRVINWIHRNAANRGSHTAPAIRAGLAQ
jgi:hypothetical protein